MGEDRAGRKFQAEIKNSLLTFLKIYDKIIIEKRKRINQMNEKQIQQYMESLGISREEALQLMADDDAIDHGAELFELTPEQAKVSKQARQTDRKPTVYNFDTSKRQRAENPDKRFLIQTLKSAVEGVGGENLTVTNIEREIEFYLNGKRYRITLSAPRK